MTMLYLIRRYHDYISSLFVFPVVCIRPYTGARGATSYKICTTETLLGYMSKSGTARAGHRWYSQQGESLLYSNVTVLLLFHGIGHAAGPGATRLLDGKLEAVSIQ